jgi:hypothetical protein
MIGIIVAQMFHALIITINAICQCNIKCVLYKVAGMDDSPMLTKISKQKLPVETEDSDGGGDEQEEDDLIVSGWGDEEQDLSDDLLKQWHYMLDKWDGRDRWEPKGEKSRSRQLVKLVRKVLMVDST